MKITIEDIKNLKLSKFRSLASSDKFLVHEIKKDVMKYLIEELREKPDRWFIEPGNKTLHINFTVIDRDDEDALKPFLKDYPH